MKRFVILLLSMLFGMAIAAFADTSTLIDFSKLTADMPDGNNTATLIDFSDKAGALTPAEKKAMKTSLATGQWLVQLNSSAQTIENELSSQTKEVTVARGAYANQKVMGIRIHFPDQPYNSYAEVMPPFDIPAFMQKTTLQSDGTLKSDTTDLNGSKFDGFGVVKNVGTLKSLSANIYGSNNPNGFGVVLSDQNNQERTIFLNYLNFDGWQTLTWQNPNYISDVRDRSLVRLPLYPHATPYYKIVGLIVYKDAQQAGGDTITYVKDISLTYDKAILDLNRDIDDEAVWKILQTREDARRNAEFQRLGDLQVLRFLEAQKMDQTPAPGTAAPAAGGATGQ